MIEVQLPLSENEVRNGEVELDLAEMKSLNPTPSTALRTGSVAKSATRMGQQPYSDDLDQENHGHGESIPVTVCAEVDNDFNLLSDRSPRKCPLSDGLFGSALK
jgi:hypothetical protein